MLPEEPSRHHGFSRQSERHRVQGRIFMKRWIALLAAGTALASCTTNSQQPVAVAQAPEPVAAEAVAAAPKAELGTYGFDAAGMDTSVRPGDNFYNFANGTWAKNTPIPADKSNYGMF